MKVKNIMMIIPMTTGNKMMVIPMTIGDIIMIIVDTNETTIILIRIMITQVITIVEVKIIEKITTIIMPKIIIINHKKSILMEIVKIIAKKMRMGTITIEEIKMKICMENITKKHIMKIPIQTGI